MFNIQYKLERLVCIDVLWKIKQVPSNLFHSTFSLNTRKTAFIFVTFCKIYILSLYIFLKNLQYMCLNMLLVMICEVRNK